METLSLKPEDVQESTLRELGAKLERRDDTKETELRLPDPLREFLRRVVAHLSAGSEVTVVAQGQELTPAQAAKYLGVSRAYVSLLLKNGVLRSRKVGTHHRIILSDIVALRRQREALASFREIDYE